MTLLLLIGYIKFVWDCWRHQKKTTKKTTSKCEVIPFLCCVFYCVLYFVCVVYCLNLSIVLSVFSLHVANIFVTQLHNHLFFTFTKKKETNLTSIQNNHFYIIPENFRPLY